VIEAHLPLVRSVASRFAGSDAPLEDLVQVGTIGLIKAVDRFDPARDRELAALARPFIEGEIRHHLRDRVHGVKVPRSDRETAARIRAASDELTAKGGRAPNAGEAAAAAGVSAYRAAEAVAAANATRPVALDPSGGTQRLPASGDDTEAAEARALLESGWEHLDARERRLLELRYREDLSQSEIARQLNLSQAHVSRLLRGALEHLRRELGVAATEPEPNTPASDAHALRSGRVLLRIPQSLHGAVAQAAAREGVSINTFIAGTLAGAVGWNETEGETLSQSQPVRPPGRSKLLVVNAWAVTFAALAGLALLLVALLR
jgi:RNA polymerase sigma-B factor